MHPQTTIYVGTYTQDIVFGSGRVLPGKGQGIHLYRLDERSGELRAANLTCETPNPSYIAVDARAQFLYAANELKTFEGEPGGAVSAFSIDPVSHELRQLNARRSFGEDPCHLAFHPSGRFIGVSNFTGGGISILPIAPDGSLGVACEVIRFEGSSAHPVMQTAPHPHSITFDREGRWAIVADLGTDTLRVFAFDERTGRLISQPDASSRLPAGSGPRHVTLHPGGGTAYVTNELHSTISSHSWDATSGHLRTAQSMSTLPEGFRGQNSAAELDVSPDGRFLYASNRGHDSVVAYALGSGGDMLERRQFSSAGGRTPRSFRVTPSGGYLLVANQDSDSLVAFRIDPASGHLEPTRQEIYAPTPVCVRMI